MIDLQKFKIPEGTKPFTQFFHAFVDAIQNALNSISNISQQNPKKDSFQLGDLLISARTPDLNKWVGPLTTDIELSKIDYQMLFEEVFSKHQPSVFSRIHSGTTVPLHAAMWHEPIQGFVIVGTGVALYGHPDTGFRLSSTPPTGNMRCLASNGTRILASGDNAMVCISDTNGNTWSQQDISTGLPTISGWTVFDMLWDGGQFVVLGSGETGRSAIATSPSGLPNTWTLRAVIDGVFTAIAHHADPKRYVIAGTGVKFSVDLTNWISASGVTTGILWNDVAFILGLFVACSVNGQIAYADPLAQTWTFFKRPTTRNLNWLGWDGEKGITGGDAGFVYVWNPADNLWHSEQTNSDQVLNDFSAKPTGYGVSIAVGNSGEILSFTPSVNVNLHRNWTKIIDDVNLGGVQPCASDGNGSVVIAYSSNQLKVSHDHGAVFSVVTIAACPGSITNVTWTGSQFMAVGDTDDIYRSANGDVWQPIRVIAPPATQLHAIAGVGETAFAAGHRLWAISGVSVIDMSTLSQWQTQSGSQCAAVVALSSVQFYIFPKARPRTLFSLVNGQPSVFAAIGIDADETWVSACGGKGILLAATSKNVLKRSTDGGATWHVVLTPQNYIHSIEFAGNRFLVNLGGTDRKIAISSDAALGTFITHSIPVPLLSQTFSRHCYTGEHLVLTDSGTVWRSDRFLLAQYSESFRIPAYPQPYPYQAFIKAKE